MDFVTQLEEEYQKLKIYFSGMLSVLGNVSCFTIDFRVFYKSERQS